MTKEEFIKACTQCGYCRKCTAVTYAEGRDNFSERDQAYRIYERSNAI